MRVPADLSFWQKETSFVEREATLERPMGAFKPYARMQANFCFGDGFPDLANRITRAAGLEEVTPESYRDWYIYISMEE